MQSLFGVTRSNPADPQFGITSQEALTDYGN